MRRRGDERDVDPVEGLLGRKMDLWRMRVRRRRSWAGEGGQERDRGFDGARLQCL